MCPQPSNQLLESCGSHGLDHQCREDSDCSADTHKCCFNGCERECLKAERPTCENKLDLAFLIDSSGSVGRKNWARLKTFVKDIIGQFEIGPDKTHVAAIAYSSKAKEVFRFDTLRGSDLNADEVNNLIDGTKWQRGLTRIDLALLLGNSRIFTRGAGMRSDARKVKMEIITCYGFRIPSGVYCVKTIQCIYFEP